MTYRSVSAGARIRATESGPDQLGQRHADRQDTRTARQQRRWVPRKLESAALVVFLTAVLSCARFAPWVPEGGRNQTPRPNRARRTRRPPCCRRGRRRHPSHPSPPRRRNPKPRSRRIQPLPRPRARSRVRPQATTRRRPTRARHGRRRRAPKATARRPPPWPPSRCATIAHGPAGSRLSTTRSEALTGLGTRFTRPGAGMDHGPEYRSRQRRRRSRARRSWEARQSRRRRPISVGSSPRSRSTT